MSTSETITKTDLKNILEAAGNIGQVDSTPTPTAGKVSEFDAAANINSTDMSTSELETFLDNLDPHGSGGGSGTPIPTANTTAAFDSNANMNSSDMTSSQVDDFVDALNVTGGITDDNGTWKSVNNYLKYSKRFGSVYIQGVSSGNLTLTAASWNNLGTLPEGYRPTSEIIFTAFDRNHLQPLWCSVTTAGVVRLYCDSGQACSYWLYGGSFPVAS